MSGLWRNAVSRLKRSTNKSPTTWAWNASIVYGMGVWSMLGYIFVKWMSKADVFAASQYGLTTERFKELSEEEIQEMLKAKKLVIQKRQQELAEHVAENVYSPADFMG